MANTLQNLIENAAVAEKAGRLDDARSLLQQALESASGELAFDISIHLARLQMQGGLDQLLLASELLNRALQQAKALASPTRQAIAIHFMALLERRRGDSARARELLDQSTILTDAPHSQAAAQFFHYRGLLASDAGEFDSAEQSYYQSHQLYRELGDNAKIAEVADSLAGLLLKRGKISASLRFCYQSLGLKRSLGDRLGEAMTLGTLGRIFLQQSRYSEAREAFEADLVLARELGDRRGMGIMLNSLGEVTAAGGDLTAAASFYRQSMEEDRSPINESFARAGLARFLVRAGQFSEAASEIDRLSRLLNSHPHPVILDATLLGLQGTLARRLGQSEQGLRLLSEAIARLEVLREPLDTVELLYEVRDLHQSQGDLAAAVEAMSKALDLLSACGATRAITDVEQWLRRVDQPGLLRLALERQLPEHLVNQIIGGKLNLPNPQRQNVTVLFNDVCGFTALTEGLGPEKIVELLNEWFSEATVAIHRHGGVVDKFIGDAVMAVFGVPEPRADAAASAVRAAIDMRSALASLNARQAALGDIELQANTGIATGEAVVGFLGSYLRQSYTVIGDTVNTASRLVGAAKAFPSCDILISESTEQAQRDFDVAESTYLGPVELKGKKQKVSVYQVLTIKTTKTAVP